MEAGVRGCVLVGGACSMGMGRGGAAGKVVEGRWDVLSSKVVGWTRKRCTGPLRGRMVLRRHSRKAVLGIEHHLLVRPLGQLDVCLVDVGGGRGELGIEGLAGLLLELGLIEGGVERGGVNGGCPAALGLLLGGKSVWRGGVLGLLVSHHELLLDAGGLLGR